MSRHLLMTCAVGATLVLCGCAEKPQTSAGTRADTPAWHGASSVPLADGWTGGDQAAWERQLHKRTQTQNEYLRIQ